MKECAILFGFLSSSADRLEILCQSLKEITPFYHLNKYKSIGVESSNFTGENKELYGGILGLTAILTCFFTLAFLRPR
jgi:hypothetical protein